MTEIDNARTLLDAGAAGLNVERMLADGTAPDLLAAVVPTGYQITTLDVARLIEPYRTAPRRTTGHAIVTDTASWLGYFGKHGGAHSEVFGDVGQGTVTAILNAPTSPATPGFGDHRVTLKLEHSAAWKVWTAKNAQLMSQDVFAEHLEERAPDLVEPDAATMLELAQSFQATTGVQFESASKLSSGQRHFQYIEAIEGKAGNRGQLDIPTEIKIQVQVWRGIAIVVPITARFRFRVERSGLRLAYVLDRVEDVLDAAWSSLLGELTDTLPVPVLAGRAPSYTG